ASSSAPCRRRRPAVPCRARSAALPRPEPRLRWDWCRAGSRSNPRAADGCCCRPLDRARSCRGRAASWRRAPPGPRGCSSARPPRRRLRLSPSRSPIIAGHTPGTGQEPQLLSEIASSLPESSRVEIQAVLTGQRAKIDVNRCTEAVPGRKLRFLLALEAPERVADVLEVEPGAAL